MCMRKSRRRVTKRNPDTIHNYWMDERLLVLIR